MTIKLRTAITFAAAFVIAVLVGLLFVHPTFFMASDVFGTWAAEHLLFAGGNPYSQQELLAAQLAVKPTLREVLPIWNPPLLFATVGWMASGSPQETVIAFAVFRALCVTVLAAVGFALSGARILSPLVVCLIATCTPAYLAEASIGQYSSFVGASFALGYLLFARRFDFWAGFVLVVVLLKPHIVLLPSILLGYRVISERRWNVLSGACLALIISGITLELIQPGIHVRWLERDVWPLQVFGSTLPSIVRSAVFIKHGYTPAWPLVVFPCLGIVLLHLMTRRLGLTPKNHSAMMIAIGLNAILSPYGFLFDQCILLVPLAYYYGSLSQISTSVINKAFVAFAMMVWCFHYALLNSLMFGCCLFWLVFPVSSAVAIFATETWLASKRSTHPTGTASPVLAPE